MSRTIDEKVVEMRFDNKQFESNVATSMSTLEKLKRSLKLDGASKGLEDIDKASKKVDMSGLGGAVESVKVKFSALDVVAVTALANITNSAVNAGKQLIKSLSVDQLSAGFQKFSDKTTSVATLVAQGNAIEDVNDQLDRLNWFTDETSYNFTEMVSNIAKFTATGKGLNESVTAMEGIATWAALSGQNAATASRAMYQLSQAMGAGTMRLEDYRSIQNASMDTEEFRQKCIDAAISLETLQDNGDGTYSSLVEGASGASWSISQFASNLTSEMWLTSDVMMKVFNEYSSAVEGIYDAAEEKNMLASEIIDEIHDKANELKTGTEATSEDIDAAIRALGYTLEDGSLQFDSFGLKAFEAAQKARTFQDAIDSVKDAVSTGWMNTFQLIFGDAEKATTFWTDIANMLWDIFAAGGETRNQFLEFALNFAKPWEAIEAKLNGSIFGKIKDVAQSFENVTDQVQNAAEKLQYFQDVVNRVWNGDFNNHGDNPDRYDLLTKAGYDWRVVQDLVNKGYQYKLTIEDVEASHKKFGLTMGLVTEETKDATEATEEATIAFEDLTDEQLVQAGLTEEEIDLYRALEKEAKRLGISVSDLAEEMSTNDGRTLLLDSFKNALQGIMDIGTVIKSAWKEIFNPPGIGEMAVKLYGIIKSLNEFSQKLILVDADTGELNETGQKLQRTFKGIFAIVDIVTTVLGGGLKIALKIISQILSYFHIDILDVTAAIGDALVKFDEWFKSLFNISGVLDKIAPLIEKAVGAIRNWFASFKESEGIQNTIKYINNLIDGVKEWWASLKDAEDLPKTIAEGIVNAFTSIPKIISTVFSNIRNAITSSFSGVDNPFGEFFDKLRYGLSIAGQTVIELGKIILEKINGVLTAHGFKEISLDAIRGLVNGLKDGAKNVWNAAVEMAKKLVQKVKDFLGIHSPSTVFMAIGGFIIAGLVAGLLNGIPDSLGAIKAVFQPMLDWLKGLDFGSIMAAVLGIGTIGTTYKVVGVLETLASPLEGLSEVFAGAGAVLTKSAKPIAKVIKNTAKVVKSFSKVLNAVAFDIKAEGIKKLGETLLMLVGAIVILTFFEPAELWNAVGLIAALAAILTVLSFAMSKINSSSATIGKEGFNIKSLSSGLIGISAAILLMAAAVKMIGSLDPKQAKQGFLGLAGMVVAIGAVVAAFGLLVKGKSAENMDKFGQTMLKMSVALLLMSYVIKVLGKLDQMTLIQGGLSIIAFSGIMVGLMAATKLISGSKNVGEIGSALIKIAAAIGLMAIVAKVLGELDRATLIQGGIAIIAFGGIMVGLMAATKLISGSKNIDSIGSTLLKIAAAIGIMGLVAKLLGGMDRNELIQGGLAIIAFSGIIVGLMAATKLISGSKNIEKIGTSLLAISGAIAIMALTAFMLSMISWEGFAKGTIMITAFAGIIVGLMAATKLISGTKNVDKIGNTLMAVAGAIAIIAGIAVLLSLVPVENLIRGTIVVVVLAAVMAGLIAVTKLAKNCLGNIIALTVMIAALAGAVYLLSTIPAESAIVSALILTGLMAAMIVVLVILNKIGSESKKALVGAIALAALGLVLMEFAWVLTSMDGLKNARKNAITLLILAGVCTLLVAVLSLIGTAAFTALAGVVALAALGLVLREFVWVLASMDGLKNARENTITLSILATVCTVLIGLLAIIGTGAITAIAGVVALAALGLVLREFVWVLASMEGLKNARANAISLSILASVCAVVLGLLTIIGFGAIAAIAGVVALAALGLVLREFVWVLSSMEGLKNATTNATILALLISTLGDVLVKISLLGPLAFVGEAAIAGLIVLIGAIGTMAVAIGVLMEKFPAIQKFLDTGLPILEKLAGSIGKMIGNFIGGIGEGLSGSLIKIGDNIAEFMDRLATASDNAAKIKAESFNGVEKLMGIMAVIAAETVGTTIADIFTLGGTSMDKFEKDGVAFFNAMKAIGEASSDVNINEEALDSVIGVAERLANFRSSLEPIGGVVSWFTGRDDLGTFGVNAAAFIFSMKIAFGSLDGVELNTEAMNSIISAATSLSKLQSTIEPMGGVIDWFTGTDDLGAFGNSVASFIDSMKTAFASLDGVSEFNTAAMDAIIDAATKLSTLQHSLESIGGVVSWFTGRDDLGKFGANVSQFISSMKTSLSTLDGATLDEEALASVITAASRLADFQGKLEPMGGVVSWFTGRDDLGKFGENVYLFACAMGKLKTGMGENGISEAVITSVTNAGNAIIALQKALPTEGLFDGKMNLSEFSKYVNDFATAMSGFITKTADINSSNITTAIDAANRIRYLIESLVGLDTSGLTTFTGIGTGGFGADGAAYQIAQTISEFSSKVAGISIEAVNVSVDAATKLKSLIYGLSGLDTSGIENFKVDTIADQMKNYSDKVSGIDTATISASITNAERLKSLIAGLTSLNTSGISNFNVSAIGEELKKYHGSISSVDMSKISSSISEATRLKSFVSSINNVNLAAVSSFKTAVDELSQVNMAGVIKAFTGSSSELETAGASVISSLVSGIRSKMSDINNIIRDIMSTINSSVTKDLSAISTAGKEIAAKLAEGFSSNTKSITTSVSSGLTVAVSSISLSYTAFYNAGSYLVTGFCNGISDNSYKAAAKAKAMAEAAVEAAREALKINSPSKVFKAIGSGIPEGFAMGIGMLGGEVEKSVTGMASSAINTTRSAMANVLDALNNDMDTQPRIRPVVDLSNVQTGVNAINGMFDGVQTVGITSSFNAINASMNRKLQNGTNDDVISAINKLRTGLDNNRGDTYNFGDFTYDSGSEVADAVGTLIRYAKIGRRV